MSKSKSVGIFVVPRSSYSWKGNEAGWITTAGWASAARILFGEAIVATTDGNFTPEECRLFPRGNASNQSQKSKLGSLRRFIPEFIITAYKDWKLKKSKPASWPIESFLDAKSSSVVLVWQRHDLFPGIGRQLAYQYGVPLITQVEAAVVWEAKKWGVNRPIWGKWLEKKYERSSLLESDLVSCVSEELRDKVISMGIPKEKVIVSHNRVDSSLFNPSVSGLEVIEEYSLKGKRIIGWTGSFRNFHGLDILLEAFKQLCDLQNNVVLMLVGDGLEFDKMVKLSEDLNISDRVVFTGRQPFDIIPQFVASFDIALVSTKSAEGFHYSPLKLREYLALGKGTIAPDAGNLSKVFSDREDLVLYKAGDSKDLCEKMNLLLNEPELVDELQKNALDWFENEGTWVHEMKTVCELLNIPIKDQ